MNNSIYYTGTVTIKTNDRIIQGKNEGTPILFKTLCELLTSTNVSNSRAFPCYMSIIKKSDKQTSTKYSDYLSDAVLISPMFISSREVIFENNTYESKFTCLLYNNLVNTSVKLDSDLYVVLLDGDQNILARYSITSDTIKTSESLFQAVIEWKMTFANSNGGNT